MRPADLALLRTPGVPDRVPRRPDRRRRRQPARPRRRRVPRPALGRAHRRLGARPAAHLRRTATAPRRSRRTAAGWPTSAPSPGAGRSCTCCPPPGGAPRRLTDHPLGAGAPVWSPDSRRLAYTARVPEEGRYGTAEGVGPEAEPPRLITTLQYRRGRHRLPDRPAQPRLRARPARPTSPTTPPRARAGPGHRRRRRRRRRHLEPGRRRSSPSSPPGTRAPTATWSATSTPSGPTARGLRRVTGSRSDCAQPAWSRTAARSTSPPSPTSGPTGPTSSPATPRCAGCRPRAATLEPLLDPECTTAATRRRRRSWSTTRVLFGVQRRGAVELLRVPLDGGEPETLVDGPFTVRGVAAGGGVVVATVAHDRSAGELVALTAGRPPAAHRVRRGSSARPAGCTGWRSGRRPRPTATRCTAGSPSPDGPGPHPVLLTVHGGPFAQYGWTLFDETQTYVSAGYAVVQCNPRGSSGLRAGARPGDPGRRSASWTPTTSSPSSTPRWRTRGWTPTGSGIMGGSYGGYMTTLLIGRTDRFAAAISERAFNDPVSFVGSSDIGWFFPDGYLGTDPERIAAQSALAGARRRSPRRRWSIHSEEDWRCPLEQGARLFVELKRRGVPTELLLFPGEGHELSRSGRPRHRLARLEHVLRWWARWLPTRGRTRARRRAPSARPPARQPDRPAGRVSGRGRAPGAALVGAAPSWSARAVLPRRRDRPAAGHGGHHRRPAGDRPPAGAARGLRLHRRRRRGGDQPPALAGRRSSGWSSAPRVLRDVSVGRPVDDAARAPRRRCRWSSRRPGSPGSCTPRASRRSPASPSGSASRTRSPPWARRSLEALAAAAPAARRWFQLYLWRDREASAALVERARAAGYEALVLTVDTPVAGPRLRDVRNGFTIPPALTAADGRQRRRAPALVGRPAHHRAAGVRLAAARGAARSPSSSTRCSSRPPTLADVARAAREPGRARWS